MANSKPTEVLKNRGADTPLADTFTAFEWLMDGFSGESEPDDNGGRKVSPEFNLVQGFGVRDDDGEIMSSSRQAVEAIGWKRYNHLKAMIAIAKAVLTKGGFADDLDEALDLWNDGELKLMNRDDVMRLVRVPVEEFTNEPVRE